MAKCHYIKQFRKWPEAKGGREHYVSLYTEYAISKSTLNLDTQTNVHSNITHRHRQHTNKHNCSTGAFKDITYRLSGTTKSSLFCSLGVDTATHHSHHREAILPPPTQTIQKNAPDGSDVTELYLSQT